MEGVYREYRKLMLDKTADPLGVLAIDDTGFLKKGRHSVCVARQYCDSLRKVDNCQIGVSLTHVGCGVFLALCHEPLHAQIMGQS